jgi:hypothetical protein
MLICHFWGGDPPSAAAVAPCRGVEKQTSVIEAHWPIIARESYCHSPLLQLRPLPKLEKPNILVATWETSELPKIQPPQTLSALLGELIATPLFLAYTCENICVEIPSHALLASTSPYHVRICRRREGILSLPLFSVGIF